MASDDFRYSLLANAYPSLVKTLQGRNKLGRELYPNKNAPERPAPRRARVSGLITGPLQPSSVLVSAPAR